MKLSGVLLAVRDLAVSRPFYEQVLGRTVQVDDGNYLVFQGGPALMAGFPAFVGFPAERVVWESHSAELYFETDDLPGDLERLKRAGVRFLHEAKEYPWGQRVARVYDPDGHIIEVGESMRSVVVRFLRRGLSVEEAAMASQFPVSFVLWCRDHPDEDPPGM